MAQPTSTFVLIDYRGTTATFQDGFATFNADDVPGLSAQMNEWGSNLKTAVSKLRGVIFMHGGEVPTLRDGLAMLEGT